MSATIEEIHEVEIGLLKEFDRVCKLVGVKYTISSGTMLGAIRHKGFIPWDDDIDVSMIRKDYELFIREAPKYLSNRYFLEHYTTEKNCPNVFAKLKDNNTTWICYEYEKIDMNHGISMDIFPVDYVPSMKKRPMILFMSRFLNRIKGCYDVNYIKSLTKPFKRFVAWVFFFPVARLLGRRRVVIWQDRFDKRFKSGELTTSGGADREKIMPIEWFFDVGPITFAGVEVLGLKEYDKYLKVIYGDDYMELPPESKRVTHRAKIVDTKRPYTDYINNAKGE